MTTDDPNFAPLEVWISNEAYKFLNDNGYIEYTEIESDAVHPNVVVGYTVQRSQTAGSQTKLLAHRMPTGRGYVITVCLLKDHPYFILQLVN